MGRGKSVIKRGLLALCMGLAVGAPAQATEKVDLDVVTRIRAEAFHNSQVMDHLTYLTENIGPRLTNSPQMAAANAWSRGKFNEWGLSNVHDDAFPAFGRGWEFTHASVEMIGDRVLPLHALPKAWTPGTDGAVEGELVRVDIKKLADLDKYKGKLRGKVLLLGDARAYKRGTEADSHRHDATSLEGLQQFTIPATAAADRAKRLKEYNERQELVRKTNEFFVAEGALAAISLSSWDNGIIRVAGGGSRKAGESAGVPELTMITEHFNPLVRSLEAGETVKLRIRVDARFTDEGDKPGYNTLAEIRGSGKADEVVMIGAHMDSWHTGTGAADNGAGVAVAMEAMRILKAIGVKPKRTIRVALWSGEEQGLIGSQDYVSRQFARFPEPTDPAQLALPASLREPTGPLQKLRDYDKLSVYFNMDNGSGRFRGIYAQENMAAMPIFEAWLKPFNDVGATTVVARNTGSTDHIAFDRVGLPGFQFIQDRLDYFSNVHHTHLDTWDHIEAEDLKQAAAVMASFAYNAAMREQMMPRKPEPKPTP
jgi:carboxypeptidase Q